ncbi:MAG TPA: hypothetical protein VE871_17265 [Longimicrobium sp.]|nr:hypothetical protein [Longimicrobium sp.]
MNRKRMLLTTTSSLDGWTVQEYLGPVSAEVVIGTGLRSRPCANSFPPSASPRPRSRRRG